MVCETWKSPSKERVLVFTVFGEASVSCWARKGKSVSPQRVATETFVGAAAERLRRERRVSAVVVTRIVEVELQRVKTLIKILKIVIDRTLLFLKIEEAHGKTGGLVL